MWILVGTLSLASSPASKSGDRCFDDSARRRSLMLNDLQAEAPEDQLYQLYQLRISQYRQNPPAADWDCVYEFDSK